MYTKGEYDSNLRRIMETDIPAISQNLDWIAKYMEIQTQLQIMEKLKECQDPKLYSPEEYQRDLKLLAEKARF